MSWETRVWEHVREFREQHNCFELNNLPIDTVFLADVELGLDLIPLAGLSSKYRVEAALAADFTGIYVDEEIFDLEDRAPPWKQNRLRFSIAHEIGHYIMHREEFETSGFRTLETFLEWTASLGGRKYDIEKEANEFAGRLLVPIEKLESEFERLSSTFKEVPGWRQLPDLRRRAAELLAQKFGVNQKAILTRFTREGLWYEPE